MTPSLEDLLTKAKTEKQIEAVKALIDNDFNVRQTARQLGVTRSSLQHMIRRINGESLHQANEYKPPEHLMPEGHKLVGVSTLTKTEDGEPQWIKTREDAKQREAMFQEAIEAFKAEIPRARPTPQPKLQRNEELLNLYVLTDYHIGMKAWGEETGVDWDIKIAENLLVEWFERAVQSSPPARAAVLGQLGDFLHWDGIEAVTPNAGHILDADTRFQKMVRVTIRSTRRILQMMLEKYEEVHVIMAEGNHDPAGSMWLREMLHEFYQDEPRLTVDTTPDNYYAISHGDVALFFHHGHKRKPEKIDDVFVAKYRKIFGDSQYAYAHMGHMHHNKVLETNLMEIEQHQTLAAPDAYATHGGWVSGRSAKCITYDKKYGEVFRITLRPEMVAT